MRIGIDIDGVTANTHEVICLVLNELYGVSYKPKDLSCWDLSMLYVGLNNDVWHAYDWAFYSESHPMFMAPSVIRQLASNGHEIHFITARRPKMKQTTMNWLLKHDIPFESVIHDGKKLEVLKQMESRGKKVDLFIEDAPHNILNLADYIPTIIFDAPYNKDICHPNTVRLSNWVQIYNYIKKGENHGKKI